MPAPPDWARFGLRSAAAAGGACRGWQVRRSAWLRRHLTRAWRTTFLPAHRSPPQTVPRCEIGSSCSASTPHTNGTCIMDCDECFDCADSRQLETSRQDARCRGAGRDESAFDSSPLQGLTAVAQLTTAYWIGGFPSASGIEQGWLQLTNSSPLFSPTRSHSSCTAAAAAAHLIVVTA